jgi:hypothetical protein
MKTFPFGAPAKNGLGFLYGVIFVAFTSMSRVFPLFLAGAKSNPDEEKIKTGHGEKQKDKCLALSMEDKQRGYRHISN